MSFYLHLGFANLQMSPKVHIISFYLLFCNSNLSGFISGDMPRNRQITVWEAFANLIDELNLEFEEITEMHAKSCTFIGEEDFTF